VAERLVDQVGKHCAGHACGDQAAVPDTIGDDKAEDGSRKEMTEDQHARRGWNCFPIVTFNPSTL